MIEFYNMLSIMTFSVMLVYLLSLVIHLVHKCLKLIMFIHVIGWIVVI
jgi:hypothetical protein